MYEHSLNIDGTINVHGIIRTEDKAFIPADERNIDWQAYCQWLKDGNEPSMLVIGNAQQPV